MRTLLRLEEVGIFCFSIFLFSLTDFSWWWFPLLILLPDIGMIGYLLNPKIGASIYNLFHHMGIAVVIYLAGYFAAISLLELTGVILLGHAALDRIFGFGLKYPDSFKHTHLGRIGTN
ncbi:DUF4260 domain-containing protein [Fodinibius salsisoli]|nr:DUF4260 domain-containing protein [Fodinibius salsisoli]